MLPVLVCIIFLFGVVLIPFAGADWIMFRADQSHDGLGTGNPALSSTLFWKYTTGGAVESSPAVVGGVVYIGSSDDKVYALNATNGAKLWSYTTGGQFLPLQPLSAEWYMSAQMTTRFML